MMDDNVKYHGVKECDDMMDSSIQWYAATLLLSTTSRIGCMYTTAFDIVCIAACAQGQMTMPSTMEESSNKIDNSTMDKGLARWMRVGWNKAIKGRRTLLGRIISVLTLHPTPPT